MIKLVVDLCLITEVIFTFSQESQRIVFFFICTCLNLQILAKPHASESVGDEVNYYLQYVKDTNLPNLESRYTCHLHRTNRSFDATIGFF